MLVVAAAIVRLATRREWVAVIAEQMLMPHLILDMLPLKLRVDTPVVMILVLEDI